MLTRVLVCPPGRAYFEADDLAEHNLKARADRQQAQSQHAALCRTLVDAGVEVVTIPELTGHPNSVFTQDVALGTSAGFIRLRMGLPSRRGEPEWMARRLNALGIPELGRIRAPGTVEGGDVVLASDVAFVGRSARTNDVGITQLTALLKPLGYEVRVVDVPPPSLHIGGMLSLVGPRQVLACAEIFPPTLFDGFEVIATPREDVVSGNVIGLGAGTVIAEARNVNTRAALEARDFTVHALDLSEFLKGTGGPTCLILPQPHLQR